MISPMNIFCQFYHYCSLWYSQLGKVISDFCSLAAWMAPSGPMKTTQQGELPDPWSISWYTNSLFPEPTE
ncbi:olfactory receptor 78, isoform CRA_b [Mus musculus]|nr:olfactory receptor 78, isoform CRA_b [Mus musculus]